MKPNTQTERIMYHLFCEVESGTIPTKKWNRHIVKEELEGLLGRYVMRYGPPLEITDGKGNLFVYEFCKPETTGDTVITVKYFRILDANKPGVKDVIVPPPPPKEEHPDSIKDLLAAGSITETNQWGY